MNSKITTYILIISLIIIQSCSPLRKNNSYIEGKYESKTNNAYLSFTKNKFIYALDPEMIKTYFCCDTISEGIWQREENFLCLSTPALDTIVLPIIVKESVVPGDSIRIYIDNPIERLSFTKSNIPREFEYTISATAINGSPINDISTTFRTNVISIIFPKKIRDFSIVIKPTENFGGRNLGHTHLYTNRYILQNENSNYFDIEIRKLTYQYFAFKRYNRDFIRIVKHNVLEWDGDFYYKEK